MTSLEDWKCPNRLSDARANRRILQPLTETQKGHNEGTPRYFKTDAKYLHGQFVGAQVFSRLRTISFSKLTCQLQCHFKAVGKPFGKVAQRRNVGGISQRWKVSDFRSCPSLCQAIQQVVPGLHPRCLL